MQELFQVIKERFDKLELVTQNKLNNDQYRDLREQEKARCEKEAWILSMFRAKKISLSSTLKSNYFKYSYEIMRIIDPSFTFQGEPNLSDETFLNDFVCLYTRFFDNYEDKFQFKVKIRNLLRPTNHNILNDMIKYLADFSRDYIQHVYIWQLKSAKKLEEAEDNQKKLSMANVQSVIYSSNGLLGQGDLLKDKPMQSFRNSVNIGETGLRKYNEENQAEILLKKSEFNKIYGLLDIQPLPNFVFLDKTKANVDVLRLRMNELYRDAKFRNNMIKSSVSLYYNAYHSKYSPGSLNANLNKQSLIQDSHPHISHPYRVSLVIERNGFSCINITSHEKVRDDRNLSPIKDRLRLSSLSNSNKEVGLQATVKSAKNDFVLNSLKVLRVSENFLPPLQNKKDILRVNSEEQANRQHQGLAKNSSYSNTQNLMNLQMEAARNEEQVIHNGVIYYNQELLREAQRRKMQKRRISQLRKHFTSEQKVKSKTGKKNDPEEKIVEWLDKINMMKQLERKKILGLS